MNSTNISIIPALQSCPSELITIYVTPFISLLGIIFNLLSTIVFTRMLITNLQVNPLYRILHAKSLLELIMFTLNVLMPIYYCRSCPISSSSLAQIWYIYLFNYSEDFLLTSSLILEIFASIRCYFNLTNSKPRILAGLSIIYPILAIISLTMIYSSFILFRFRIVRFESGFTTERTDYFNSSFDTLVRFVQSFIRDVLLIILLFVLQSFMIVIIQRQVSGNLEANALMRFKRKTILMVITCGMIYVLGHLPIMVYYLPFSKNGDLNEFWSCYYLFSLVPFYLSYLPNFFIYCYFNKIFLQNLREFLGLKITYK